MGGVWIFSGTTHSLFYLSVMGSLVDCNNDFPTNVKCVVPENMHTPPCGRFFVPPPIPQEISVKLYTLLLKFWLLRPPFPMTFHGGMNFFLNYTGFKMVINLTVRSLYYRRIGRSTLGSLKIDD